MNCETNQKSAKRKNVKKLKTSRRKKGSDSSSDEAVDLSEKIHPIIHYVNDREEMIKQVFSVMEKEKLNCMLPPILKGMTMSVLRESCLKELRNMSDDEVRKVLCGECIETPDSKVVAPSKIDSDSSVSSIEECQNAEQEKRTLLDILEQEMQEIAYNTVLKRDEKSPEIKSDDDLAEVVALTPVSSPSRANNNVPLIFIDSEDEETITTNTSQSKSLAAPEPSAKLCNDDVIIDEVVTATSFEDRAAFNMKPSIIDSMNCETAGSRSKNRNQLSSKTPTEASSKSQESFVIQVYSRKTSLAERVVKKIYKSNKSLDKELSDDKNEYTADNNVIGCDEVPVQKESNLLNEANKQEVSQEQVNKECGKVACLRETVDVGCDHSSVTPSVDTFISLDNSITQASVKANKDVSKLPETEEKEEGEITGEESEEDVEVLQTLQDRQQSPPINLSSDDCDIKGLERSESRGKVCKHHHRHRRTKRSADSPERSRRRIDKRGNRSYRRKASSSVKENLNFSETKEDGDCASITAASCDLLNDTSSDAFTETPSAGQDSEASSKLPITKEEVEKEKEVDENSLHTLEINISDSKLDSSEEEGPSHISEPVPTKTSWADRWAEKKDLKKLAITSKICRNVRKRILSARRKQLNPESCSTHTLELPPIPPLVLHVEGSVQEYQMLQLLVSDVCDEHPKNDQKRDDIGDKELSLPILDSVTCDDVNSTVRESNKAPELPLQDLEQEVTNKVECSGSQDSLFPKSKQ